MPTLLIQELVLTGLEATYAAADAGGDEFVVSPGTFVHVKNGSGGDITVTVDSKKDCDQASDHNSVTVVTAGEERFIGPFEDSDRWGDPNSKRAAITYSGVTSLTIAAIKL